MMRTQLRCSLVLICAGLALTACDQSPSAVSQASAKLASLGAAGAQSPTLDFRRRTYTDAISTVRSAAGADDAGTKAAANIVLARAELGLAEVELAAAAEHARAIRAALLEAENTFASWYPVAVEAERLDAYDPSGEIADLESRATTKRGERDAASAAIDELDTRVADLRDQAEQFYVGARAKEVKQRELMATAARSEPIARARIARQELDIKREIAELETAAESLLADADHANRERRALELLLAEKESQLELIRAAVVSLRERARSVEAQADAMQAQADALAVEAMQRLAEASTMRSETFNPAMEATNAGLSRARSAVAKARSGDRVAAATVGSAIEHAFATAASIEMSLDALRLDLLTRFASADPGLPERDTLIAQLDEARAAAQASEAKTEEAYDAAIDAIEALSGLDARAEASRESALAKLNERLGRDPAADEAQTSDDAPASDVPAESGFANPEDLLDAIVRGEAPADAFVSSDGVASDTLLVGLDAAAMLGALDQAMSNAFGVVYADLRDPIADPAGLLALASLGEGSELVYVDDATVNVSVPGAPEGAMPSGLVLVLSGETWVVDADQTLASVGDLDGLFAYYDALASAAEPVLDALIADEYAGSDAAASALEEALPGTP